MQSDINTKRKGIWKRLSSKVFRDAFVAGELINSIGAQIFSLREQEGWTQTELAKRSGMAQARVSLLESASGENFNLNTLKRIAAAFDVALSVRFVPFSELLESATPTSDEWLIPTSFKDDEVKLVESQQEKGLKPFVGLMRSRSSNPRTQTGYSS